MNAIVATVEAEEESSVVRVYVHEVDDAAQVISCESITKCVEAYVFYHLLHQVYPIAPHLSGRITLSVTLLHILSLLWLFPQVELSKTSCQKLLVRSGWPTELLTARRICALTMVLRRMQNIPLLGRRLRLVILDWRLSSPFRSICIRDCCASPILFTS